MAYHGLRCRPRSRLECSKSEGAEILGCLILWRVVWTTYGCTPSFDITTIATPTRLLGDEEADVVT